MENKFTDEEIKNQALKNNHRIEHDKININGTEDQTKKKSLDLTCYFSYTINTRAEPLENTEQVNPSSPVGSLFIFILLCLNLKGRGSGDSLGSKNFVKCL